MDNSSGEVPASSYTDITGYSDVVVEDDQVRDIIVRAITTTDHNPFLKIRTELWDELKTYFTFVLESSVFYDHDPSQDIDFETIIAGVDYLSRPFLK